MFWRFYFEISDKSLLFAYLVISEVQIYFINIIIIIIITSSKGVGSSNCSNSSNNDLFQSSAAEGPFLIVSLRVLNSLQPCLTSKTPLSFPPSVGSMLVISWASFYQLCMNYIIINLIWIIIIVIIITIRSSLSAAAGTATVVILNLVLAKSLCQHFLRQP